MTDENVVAELDRWHQTLISVNRIEDFIREGNYVAAGMDAVQLRHMVLRRLELFKESVA